MNLIHMQKFNTEIILKGNMFYGKNAFNEKLPSFFDILLPSVIQELP